MFSQMQPQAPHKLEQLSTTQRYDSESNPWHEYNGWKIWNVPDSHYFVCVREDAGKVLEVNKTLPISTIVRTIELALDDREQTPTATWQQVRQVLAESKAAFWWSLLEVARHKEELRKSSF
ncbi:MAG: hypothetical protein SWY16_12115 [Cyanobacteriota bacterium]|nr:hypothetical protein [Cyanobacteriota bacterium]